MPPSLPVFLAQCLLIFGLATPGIAPYSGVYFAIAAMLAGLLSLRAPIAPWRLSPYFLLLISSIVLLAIPLPFHWTGLEDLFPLLVLVPVLLAPGAAIYASRQPGLVSLETASFAMLGGAAASAGIALFEFLALDIVRPGGGNNPIHFAGIATVLGFGALCGFFLFKGPWRLVFLLGPISGAIAVLLSGSRGPGIALLCLAALAFLFLLFTQRKSRWIWVVVIAVPALFIAFWFFMHDIGAFDRIFESVRKIPWALTDLQSSIGGDRPSLITGAIGAFLDAVIVGHGYSHMMSSVLPHVAPEYATIAEYDHLHSDLANFGVSSGVFGIAGLLVVIVTPIVAAWSHKGTSTFTGALYLGVVTSAAYFLLGMTNAVIGVLPQTALFGVLLGLLAGTSASSNLRGDHGS